jgi:alpha-tubulin suppressor-like RCC1 family protein
MLGLRITWVLLAAVAVAPAGARADDTQVSVSAGATHTCALLSPSGHVECWGEGAQGQLGDGTTTASPIPVAVTGLVGAKGVSVGTDHSCAVLSDGGIVCWGFATHLYLDTGKVVPAPVRGASGAIVVSAGAEHDCAVQSSGGVQCWGAGTGGELGNGAKADSATAVAVSGIGSAVAVSAGAGHTCAVLSSGQVQCWGRGLDGELGNGVDADSATPVTVSGITSAIAVSSGTNHACAVLAGGGVACWGSNRYGQLGDGGSAGSATPVTVSGVTDAVMVSAGGVHTCALLASGSTVCWGHGGDGELGDGVKHNSAAPVAARGLDAAIEISAGLSHTCASVPGPRVVCWGAGERGQLGDGRSVSSVQPVTALLTLSPPVFGDTMTLQKVSGTVRVKPPGSASFVALGAVSSLPVGTTVDTTQGKVRLTSAADTAGRTQAGLFYGGEFKTSQRIAEGVGLTVLTLARAPSGCASAAAASVAAGKKKRKKKVSLWGDAQGDFQSAGRYASATVRGTKWLVEDSCEGTTVRVTTGAVRVENLVTHKTTSVSAPHSVVVRASGGSSSGSGRSTTRSFVASVERVLTRLASGRKKLSAALDGALRCSISPRTASQRVSDVIKNRSSLRDDVVGLSGPTERARTVRARLKAAIDHSLAADRHYRDWLSGITAASCPLPQTAAFAAAGREDVKATRAKKRFVAAFNPLARREHLRTWRAAQF